MAEWTNALTIGINEIGCYFSRLICKLSAWQRVHWGDVGGWPQVSQFNIRGKTCKSIRSMALEFGLPPKRLENCIRRGELEDQWLREVDRIIPRYFKNVSYQGKEFSSIIELVAHLGIEDSILGQRINDGWPEEEWAIPVRNSRINYRDRVFSGVKALAVHLGISRELLKGRIQLGWPEEDWDLPVGAKKPVTRNGIPVEHLGQTYPSLSTLASHLVIPIETLRGRMAAGLPQEEWGKQKESVCYRETEYSSLKALAKHLSTQGLGSHAGIHKKLKRCLKDGVKMDESVSIATTNLQNKEVTYLGRVYKSMNELGRELPVPFGTLYERIRNGWPESYWAVERLPVASPDFYFHLLSGGVERGRCYFYVVRLNRFPGYLKIGVAWSLALRRDVEYGEDLCLIELDNRLKVLAFEQAALHSTRNWMSCPSELPFAKTPWIGRSEVRRMEWEPLQDLLNRLRCALEENGLKKFVLNNIPLNERRKKALFAMSDE
jgi:hypothetical protein